LQLEKITLLLCQQSALEQVAVRFSLHQRADVERLLDLAMASVEQLETSTAANEVFDAKTTCQSDKSCLASAYAERFRFLNLF
jgi:uncharacterized protein